MTDTARHTTPCGDPNCDPCFWGATDHTAAEVVQALRAYRRARAAANRSMLAAGFLTGLAVQFLAFAVWKHSWLHAAMALPPAVLAMVLIVTKPHITTKETAHG